MTDYRYIFCNQRSSMLQAWNLLFYFQWGYGNWKEIAHHIETKTPEQTKQEYLRNYIYGVVGRYTWKEELRGYQIDHTQVNSLKTR